MFLFLCICSSNARRAACAGNGNHRLINTKHFVLLSLRDFLCCDCPPACFEIITKRGVHLTFRFGAKSRFPIWLRPVFHSRE